jgi:hypothetical protein
MQPAADSVAASLAAELKREMRNLCRRRATVALRRDLADVRLKNAR